ncbi:MAG: hypothetical protein K6F09_08615 [Clostridiales bacterium]|nr:hypothetical protein [Clostridiales bacterium]
MAIVDSREKNKRVAKNIVSSLLYEFTILAFGLVVPKLYLSSFGSEVNGLVNTVKQLYAYMIILEAGVGMASQQALYKPVALDDRDRINSIVSATHHYYRRVVIAYSLISVVFGVLYSIVVYKDYPHPVIVFIIVILYSIPGVLRFLIQGKYRIFLEVEGKSYVIKRLSTTMLFVSNVLRLLALIFTNNLILIQVTYCLPAVLQFPIVLLYIKKVYPWLDIHAKPDLEALKKKNSVLVHQIANLMFTNTDMLIISTMCGLKEASIYTIYSLFFSNIEKLVRSFTEGISFRLGQMFHTDRDKFLKLYEVYEAVFFTLIFIGYTLITAFLLPVINIYTSGVDYSAEYINAVLLVLFSVSYILIHVKVPMTQALNYDGSFDKTRHQAIIEASLNLSVSVAATLLLNMRGWGIAGCLAGTIIALLYSVNALIFFTNKKILGRSCFNTYKRLLLNGALMFAILFFMWKRGYMSTAGYIGPDGSAAMKYLYVCGKALLNALWVVPIFAFVNALSDFKVYKSLPEFVRKAVKRGGAAVKSAESLPSSKNDCGDAVEENE